MRKFLICLLWCPLALTLAADNYYSKLGKYSDVTILKVDHHGILISHAYGICHITEKDLSTAEKKQLNSQIQSYRKKAAIYDKKRVAQQIKLKTLSEQLPNMSRKEIESWALQEVKVDVLTPEFRKKFMERFNLISRAINEDDDKKDSDTEPAEESTEKVLKKIYNRLINLSEQSVRVNNCDLMRKKMIDLSAWLPEMSLTDIEKWIQTELKSKLNEKAAMDEWMKRFEVIDYQYKIQLVMQDNDSAKFNKKKSCKNIFKDLQAKACNLQQEDIAELEKILPKGNNAINRMMRAKLGISVEYKDFKDKFNAKYCFVENREQIAARIQQQVQKNNDIEKQAQAARKARYAWASQANYNSNSSVRCADCGGSGIVRIRQGGIWLNVRCNGCSGTGQPHFATDYINSNGRQRSLMDQQLGRMMGIGGPGGIFQ